MSIFWHDGSPSIYLFVCSSIVRGPLHSVKWVSSLRRTTWMMGQIATLLVGLVVSLVLFWVWWSTIHRFICYSKVCVGISTPTRGVSALTKIGKAFQQNAYFKAQQTGLSCTPSFSFYTELSSKTVVGLLPKRMNIIILCSDWFMHVCLYHVC